MFSEPDQAGQVIDQRYRVLSRLGQGGMGTVYLAEHIGLGQRRAIKFLRPEVARHPSARKRFLQEAQVVASLRHEHVIEVIDLGESGGAAYYVMELLEGEDLRALLRRDKALPWPRVRTIILQICGALRAAHAKHITHRDLKPENCFCVVRDSGEDFIKLLDFGIAKVAQEPGSTHLTGTGEPLGTVGYMALEQFFGQADQRSDIYALGVMMYEMLAGKMPYQGHTADIIIKLNNGTLPQALQELVPGFPSELTRLVDRAMAPRADDRFPDVAALITALKEVPEFSAAGPALEAVLAATPEVDGSAPTMMPSRSEDTRPPAVATGLLTDAQPMERFRAPASIPALPGVRTDTLAGRSTGAAAASEPDGALTTPFRPQLRPKDASLVGIVGHAGDLPAPETPANAKTLLSPPAGRWRGRALVGAAMLVLVLVPLWLTAGAGEADEPGPEPEPLLMAYEPAPVPGTSPKPITNPEANVLTLAVATTSGGEKKLNADSAAPEVKAGTSITPTTPTPSVPKPTKALPKALLADELMRYITVRLKTCNHGISEVIKIDASPGKPFASLYVADYGDLRPLDLECVKAKLKVMKVLVGDKVSVKIDLPKVSKP